MAIDKDLFDVTSSSTRRNVGGFKGIDIDSEADAVAYFMDGNCRIHLLRSYFRLDLRPSNLRLLFVGEIAIVKTEISN